MVRAIGRVWANAGVQRSVAMLRRLEAPLVRFGSPALSIALLAVALAAMRHLDWQQVAAAAPARPAFWFAFLLFYATPIVADWAIFRRLWGIPARGALALLRKAINNDLLIGYSGEAYLYTWARRTGQRGGAVLATLKDVSILSAAVGNGVTIAAGLAALPFLHAAGFATPGWLPMLALVAVLSPPIVATLLRGKLIHLPERDVAAVLACHLVRALATSGFTILMWHLAMPAVAATTWLVLIAAKLLVSRLPFVSNKELVFASVTVLLLGPGAAMVALVTLIATMQTATHVLLGLGLALGGDIPALFARTPQDAALAA